MTDRTTPTEQPLTEAQLSWISESTRRAVNHALRVHTRRAAIGFVILAAGLGISIKTNSDESVKSRDAIVDSGNVVSVIGCNRDFGTFERAIVAVKDQSKRGLITKTQEKQALDFYEKEIPDCRDASKILTEDPENAPAPPTPRFVGDPNWKGG